MRERRPHGTRGRAGLLLWVGLICLVSVEISNQAKAEGGIPKKRVHQIGSASITLSTENLTQSDNQGVDPPPVAQPSVAEHDEDGENEHDEHDTFDSPILTDLEDLEAEWKEFDQQWDRMKEREEIPEAVGEHFHSVVMALSLIHI